MYQKNKYRKNIYTLEYTYKGRGVIINDNFVFFAN
jgi:hypothetical protein